MAEYEFTLKFKLPSADADVDALVERLGEAGCNDALVGVGVQGRIALDFTRNASSALEALSSAIKDVRKATPGAQLIEVGPDLVGLTDVAEMVSVTRQNMQKLMTTHFDFPSPVYTGPIQLWHLGDLLSWLERRSYQISGTILEMASVALQCNVAMELEKVGPPKRLWKL